MIRLSASCGLIVHKESVVFKNGKWVFAAALLVGIIVAITHERDPIQTAPMESNARPSGAVPVIPGPSVEPEESNSVGPSRSETLAPMADDVDDGETAFATDAAGELVVNEQTRLNMEMLIAQAEPGNLWGEVAEQTEHLPPQAARQAEELLRQFVEYQQAQRQTYPPGDAPVTEDDALRELDGLHALRVAHFGPEVARRLYGNDEKIAREMIEVMRLENDQSLTTEEKQQRARALRERLPGIDAIEAQNRADAAARDASAER